MAEENAVITPEAESSEVNLSEQMKIRREKLFAAQSAGKNPYEIVSFNVTSYSEDIKNNFEELEGSEVNIAGRMMSRRIMGKASFANVQDTNGNIQLYVSRNDIGDDNRVLNLLEKQPEITAKKMSEQLSMSPRKISRIIKRLRENNIIIRIGSDRKGYWEIQKNKGITK